MEMGSKIIDIVTKFAAKTLKIKKSKYRYVSKFIEDCIKQCDSIIEVVDINGDKANAIHKRIKNLYNSTSNSIGDCVKDSFDIDVIVKALAQGRIYFRVRQLQGKSDAEIFELIQQRNNAIIYGNYKIWGSSYEHVLQKVFNAPTSATIWVPGEINNIRDMAIAEMEILKELKSKYDKLLIGD